MRNLIHKYRNGVLQGKAIRGRLACVMAGAALAGVLCAYGQISSVAATQTGKATSSDWMIKSVDGDGYTDDAVREVDYSLDDSRIVGYASVPDQALYTLTYTGEDYAVTVTYGEDAMLPEDVELVATEYAQDSEVWQTRYAEAATLYNWNTDHSDDVRLFNVGLYEDGTEVEPQAEVSVLIAYSGKDGLTNYTVTHFGEQTETITARSDYEDGAQTVRFDVNSFSDIMVSVAEETATEEGEPGDPEALQELVDSGYFDYWSSVIAEQEDTEDQITLPAKSTFSLRSAIASLLGITSSSPPSSQQIDNSGGSNSNDEDGVKVSKTIAGTDTENVFDITLSVETTTNVSELYTEPDMAVVIVMDISNSMSSTYGDTTRYAAAVESAEFFIDQFADETNGVSQIGFVAFNSNAMKISDMSVCSSDDEANTLKDTIRTNTGYVMQQYGFRETDSTNNPYSEGCPSYYREYVGDGIYRHYYNHEYYVNYRFTNIEAGLKMASDMLNDVTNENKYIIFLSDGFPTTYIENGYNGYNPYTSSGTKGADGVFYDYVSGYYCVYGASYSDKAAIRARDMATTIKSSGTNIFSIGVDVGAQTIDGYEVYGKDYSVIDRTGHTYEIGSSKYASAFKNWLKGTNTTGIGSGYYYDSTDEASLQSAFDQIFEEIQSMNEASSQAQWVATDPLPSFTGGTDTTVEFLGFYDSSNTLQVYEPNDTLTGSNVKGGENSASYITDGGISWDLKSSGYTTSTSGSTTTYAYTLTYRVRLQNESDDFVENASTATNGDASLTYQTVTTENGETVVSEEKSLDFPVPEVKGYLGELTFTKVDQDGSPLPGVTFTLSHDTTTCSTCRGDGTSSVALEDMTATSDKDGVVSFTDIPSGHTYTLTETTVPEGYSAGNNVYIVTVSYDEVTVTVTNGSENVEWNGTIVNYSDPTVEKKVRNSDNVWVDKNTASVNDNVVYKSTISNLVGATNLKLHDELSDGLTDPYVSSVEIVTTDADGNETEKHLDEGSGYTVTYYIGENTTGVTATDDCSFEVVFDNDCLVDLTASDVIVVYYRATVTTDAVIGAPGNPNETYISYGTDSESEHDMVVTYVYEVDVHKYSGDQSLSGAKFVLYYEEEIGSSEPGAAGGSDTVYKYAIVDDDGCLSGWTNESTAATTLTTDNSGMIYIKGLGPRTYFLEETEAPEGYTLLENPVVIELAEDGSITYYVDGVSKSPESLTPTQIEVENISSYELPKTGGLGTLYFIPAGLLLSGAALTLWHGKHR